MNEMGELISEKDLNSLIEKEKVKAVKEGKEKNEKNKSCRYN